MKPKFKDIAAWEQAQLLMQPAFIRVIDNLRQQLELSPWQGTYQEVQTPYPGHQLCLTYQDRAVKVDLWDLCFQICFRNYHPLLKNENGSQTGANDSQEVEIDTNLIDETGEVDWQQLETKTQQIIREIFANLPSDLESFPDNGNRYERATWVKRPLLQN